MESTVKRLRKKLGLTQNEFANALNITAATVSRIESGKAPLTNRMLHSIAMEWNVSEEWLRTGEFVMNTGTRLKQLRESLNLTQAEFSHAIHMAPATISMIEAGKRTFTDRMIHILNMEFGVSEDWLRTGNGEMFPSHPEDEELIETYALLGADRLSPQHKRLAISLFRTIASLPDEALPALRDCLRNAAQALDESTPDAQGKKDED